MKTLSIGIIPDTHGLLRPEAERHLAGVDHIIHGGDIGRPEVLVALRRIAPVTAIRGNVDIGDWAQDYADAELVRLAARAIYVLHDLKTLRINPVAEGIDMIISEHSHKAAIENERRGTLPQPGQRGAAAVQAADHACYARYRSKRLAAYHSSS